MWLKYKKKIYMIKQLDCFIIVGNIFKKAAIERYIAQKAHGWNYGSYTYPYMYIFYIRVNKWVVIIKKRHDNTWGKLLKMKKVLRL